MGMEHRDEAQSKIAQTYLQPRGGGERVYQEHQHQAEGKGHPQDSLTLAWGVKKESDHF